ncbi:MAG: C39 family peptidase [Pirellulaceae bacterium]|nr:C39 family peptidase [Pirellulaceae bacterium]
MKRQTVSIGWLVLASSLCAVSAQAQSDSERYKTVLIKDIPHVRQKPDFCGEACAEMFLKKLGHQKDQDFVFDQAGLDPLEGRGCYTRELSRALSRIGFRTGPVWHTIAANNAARQLDDLFADMHADLLRGVPSILCMHYDERPQTTEHFRLVIGYDDAKDEIVYHEPAVDRGGHRRMKRDTLLALWPLKYDANRWTVIRMRLDPGELIAGRAARTLTDADYAQHILALKANLARLKATQIELKKEREAEIAAEREKVAKAKEAGEEYEPKKLEPRIVSSFHIVLEKPFVVVGDESPRMVRRRAEGTIAWAVRRLKQDYFSNDPDHVITVWLFGGKRSYKQNVYDLFRSRPHTPYGYYSPSEKALVMDISTGGGTLVHEIVHPFMAANFSRCPSWLNEGMGSLYEQCEDRRGHIWGLTNWRLRGLQEAIRKEDYEVPTFKTLCETTRREFYSEDPGTNYSQARYLCYYLQQHGLLVKFYHEFQKAAKDDPSGYETLQKVLDVEDMEKFQEEWSEFVLGLRY